VVLSLQFGLRAFGAGTDGFCVVAVECPGGFGVVYVGLLVALRPEGEVGVVVSVNVDVTSYNCGPSSSHPAIKSATPNGRDMTLSSPSAPSPNLNARSQIACVQLSTPSFSL